jgi:hypothetical protein
MNNLTQSEINLLKLILDPKISSPLRKFIINKSNNKTISSLCELVLNILNGNIQVSTEIKSKLLPFAKICRKLLNKRTNLKEKKKILIGRGIQRGGFLQFIFPALASIASIISSIVSATKKE